MNQPEMQLNHEAKSAIRAYLVHLFAIPGIIVTLISFAAGFFVNHAIEAAKDKSSVDAYEKAASRYETIAARIIEIASQAEVTHKQMLATSEQIANLRAETDSAREITRNTVQEVASAKETIAKALRDAEMALENANKANESIQATRASLQTAEREAQTALAQAREANQEVQRIKDNAMTVDAFLNAENVVRNVAKTLTDSHEFSDAVADSSARIVQEAILGQLDTIVADLTSVTTSSEGLEQRTAALEVFNRSVFSIQGDQLRVLKRMTPERGFGITRGGLRIYDDNSPSFLILNSAGSIGHIENFRNEEALRDEDYGIVKLIGRVSEP